MICMVSQKDNLILMRGIRVVVELKSTQSTN